MGGQGLAIEAGAQTARVGEEEVEARAPRLQGGGGERPKYLGVRGGAVGSYPWRLDLVAGALR
jgi:hypothetical protein